MQIAAEPRPLYFATMLSGFMLGVCAIAVLTTGDHDQDHWALEFGVGKGLVVALIGWIVTFAVAQFVFNQFQRKQLQISRFAAVAKFEDDMLVLHAAKTARRVYATEAVAFPNARDGEELELRFVLDDQPWIPRTATPPKMVGGAPQIAWRLISGQRFWAIRDGTDEHGSYTDFVSSRAVMEAMSWFRKVSRACGENILRQEDLMHLWRQILPLAYCNRLTFMERYFQGAESIQEYIDVVRLTLDAVRRAGLERPIQHFDVLASNSDKVILHDRQTGGALPPSRSEVSTDPVAR